MPIFFRASSSSVVPCRTERHTYPSVPRPKLGRAWDMVRTHTEGYSRKETYTRSDIYVLYTERHTHGGTYTWRDRHTRSDATYTLQTMLPTYDTCPVHISSHAGPQIRLSKSFAKQATHASDNGMLDSEDGLTSSDLTQPILYLKLISPPRLALHPLTYTLELPQPTCTPHPTSRPISQPISQPTSQPTSRPSDFDTSSHSTPSYLSQRMAKAKMVSKLFSVDGILLNWRCEWISYCITDYSQMANAIYLYLVAVVIWL